jgi:hypothetical protein
MRKPNTSFSSGKTLKASTFILVGFLVLFLASSVIAGLYQATRGNASLFEVSRNISLPEDADDAFSEQTPISSLTFQDVQSKYSELTNDDQWREYALSILGNHVDWSGKVSSIESRRVEIDMGTAPLRYLVLLDVPDEDKARMSIGDQIEFEGRLQGFHLVKGMNPVVDNVRIK